MSLRRFTRVPEQVRALDLPERRLAWGLTDDGRAVVATVSALHLDGVTLPWTEVEKASWEPPVLVVREVAEVDGAGAVHRVSLAEDHRLAETVRACVTSSVGWSDVRRLDPSGSVRLVGRRVPGRDAMLWQVVFFDGADPGDPRVRAQADEAVAALRATLG